ncbi:LysR family transcriptional regulator [Pyxidicoccus fallax]|uniref:LysR family transcriptional regulator n=1 Tax=Pyxidicoccus fallax TaxID=394095 RepID=A0A848LPQ2_9BACT|nr:LysR family transcriptional regulator [Pyxidicoccus fallax]NMO19649.1 LysR family transcriptional regulator [Pyxidicoccus fallax]NPC80445.1 LysR family transcriptional regulator [Pyxidicoccus fallax]
MMNRLSGVLSFVQAADAGSFALAAERMGLSRSAVGKSIARLEERLGTRLFVRTTRNQSLTDDGQAFYERCVRALSELEAAEAVLDSGRRAPTGRLRVSAPVMIGRCCAAPVLWELARQHPGLELEIAFSDRVVDLIEDGYDLAVRVAPLTDHAGLTARRLGVQEMVVCASPEYLARHGRPETLADVEHHEVVAYGRNGVGKPWRFPDGQGGEKVVPIRSRLLFDDVETVADATTEGAGLGWLPSWLVAERIRDGRLVVVLEQERRYSNEVFAVWPQNKHLPSKVRAAIDALVARIPERLAACTLEAPSVSGAAGSPGRSPPAALPSHHGRPPRSPSRRASRR